MKAISRPAWPTFDATQFVSACKDSKRQLMKQNPKHLITKLAFVLAAAIALNQSNLLAQTNAAPPPPAAPSAGLINDFLRKQSDGFKAWDIGGQFRARYDMRQNFATPGL